MYTLFINDDNIDHGDKLFLQLVHLRHLTEAQRDELFNNRIATIDGKVYEIVAW